MPEVLALLVITALLGHWLERPTRARRGAVECLPALLLPAGWWLGQCLRDLNALPLYEPAAVMLLGLLYAGLHHRRRAVALPLLLDGLLALCLARLVDSLPNALWLGALLACGLPLLRRLFALQRIASHAPEVPASLRGKPLQLILAGLLCLALTSLEPLLLP